MPETTSLQHLLETIRDIIPDAEETISYGVPGYRLGGEVIAGFAAAKRHLSYPPHSDTVLPALEAEVAAYSCSNGTLRFDIGSTLPSSLVRMLIQARVGTPPRSIKDG